MERQQRAATTVPQGPAGTVLAALSLPWLVAGAALFALALAGGLWNLVANTRLLDLLIEGGVVRYHDLHIGPVDGIPDLKYYIASQDPVAWSVLLFSVFMMFAFWALKGVQVRYLAARGGHELATTGEALRLYATAQGADRWFPWRAGDSQLRLTLQRDGADTATARAVVENVRFIAMAEILFFAGLSLVLLGWTTWLSQVAWALTILAAAYLVLRQRGSWASGIDLTSAIRPASQRLLKEPLAFLGIFALSASAFFLEHVAVYAMSQAFTSANVIINIQFPVFLTALVAGNLARLIPFTPGGLGQFEWGFALAIYVSGTGMPEAVTVALLFMLLRYGAGALFNLVVRLRGKATGSASVAQLVTAMRPD